MDDKDVQFDLINTLIRLGLTFSLLFVSMKIMYPFLSLIVWAAIIATATHPLNLILRTKLGGSDSRAAIAVTFIMLMVVILPSIMLAESLIETTESLSASFSKGHVNLPKPSEKVAEWPLVGEKIYNAWSDASADLEKFSLKYTEDLKSLGVKLVSVAAVTVTNLAAFIVSIIIAGVFLKNADDCHRLLNKFANRLLADEGSKLVELSSATVRSVAKGVLGTAMIQTALATIGLVVIDVPGVGFWAMLILLAAVAQLPPILILGPIAAYVYSVEPGWVATIFLVYSFMVSSSDALLKPLLLGRGVELPMLVILIGAIGGMIVAGIVGLFTGAVVLGLSYQLFITWLEQQPIDANSS